MTARYVEATTFNASLRSWSAKPSRPTNQAPCGWLEGDNVEAENEVLARTFDRVCERHDMSDRLSYLTATIIKFERLLQLGYDDFRGKSDVSSGFNSSDRIAHVRLRPMRMMIDAMKDWLAEMHEDATYTSPARRPSNQNHAHQPGESA